MTERMARKKLESKDRLSKSAEELILSKGYANTTIDEIAEKADVSKGAVYLHYGTKADIYFCVVSKALETMRDTFRQAVDQESTGLEKFAAIGLAFYDYSKKYPKYANAVYDKNAPRSGSGSECELKCRSLTEEIHAMMVSSIELGRKDGSIREDVDPQIAAMVISSSLRGLIGTLVAEGEMLKRRGIDERYLVDYAISLYGRSLMSPDGKCSPESITKRKRSRP